MLYYSFDVVLASSHVEKIAWPLENALCLECVFAGMLGLLAGMLGSLVSMFGLFVSMLTVDTFFLKYIF